MNASTTRRARAAAGAVFACGLLAGMLIQAVPASAATVLTVGPNVNVSQAAGNQSEGSIAVDPTNPLHIFAFSNVTTAAALFAGVSTDGGATWTTRLMATGGGGDGLPTACCDPSGSFDSFGNLFVTYLTSSLHTVVVISTDGGATFTPAPIFDNGSGSDQPTVVTGPGSVWVTYNQSTTRAAGASVTGLGTVGAFSAPQAAPASAGLSFGDIAVGPSGQMMIAVQNSGSGNGPDSIRTFLDADGLGAGGFAAAVTATATNVGGFDFIPPQPSRSVDSEAGLAWDRTGGAHDGRVYLVYTDETVDENNDTEIFVRFSDDDGATWSGPVRVNDDATVNSQFNPKISLDQTTGTIAVSWHDSRNDDGMGGPGDTDGVPNDNAQFFGTVSDNGGASFLPNVMISEGTSDGRSVTSGNVIEYGDYTGLSFQSGKFHPFWADNSNSTGDNPNGALAQLDMYTATVDVTTSGGGGGGGGGGGSQLIVSIAGTGDGSVTSDPPGIQCRPTCSMDVTTGTHVRLTATAAAGSTFDSWSGACSGNGFCDVEVFGTTSAVATFTLGAASADVEISKAGPVDGTVGQPLSFDLTVTDHGPATAAAVIVTDLLAPGLLFSGATASAGTCTESAGTVSCAIGDLANGATATVTVDAVPFRGGTIENSASVTATTDDPDATNNVSSTDVGVQVVCTQTGTADADSLSGTDGIDVLCGRGGDDVLRGLQANDILLGGKGADTLRAGDGDDLAKGGPGDDVLRGGPGTDDCDGGPGTNELVSCEGTPPGPSPIRAG